MTIYKQFRAGTFDGTAEMYFAPLKVGDTVSLREKVKFVPFEFKQPYFPRSHAINLQDQADVDRFNAMLGKENAPTR